jgi:hypothetical protein
MRTQYSIVEVKQFLLYGRFSLVDIEPRPAYLASA